VPRPDDRVVVRLAGARDDALLADEREEALFAGEREEPPRAAAPDAAVFREPPEAARPDALRLDPPDVLRLDPDALRLDAARPEPPDERPPERLGCELPELERPDDDDDDFGCGMTSSPDC
jgi:hypothetical protein